MNNNLIIAIVAVVAVAGGAFYAWNSGLLNFPQVSGEIETQQASVVETETQQSEAEPVVVEEVEGVEEPVDEYGRTEAEVQEFEEKPRLCETDADCKIIPITCNECDCGRAVNVYIEPYACTEEDKADPCPLVLDCKQEKAVCNQEEGVCEKAPA